jgi:hypothetical protein
VKEKKEGKKRKYIKEKKRRKQRNIPLLPVPLFA